MAKITKFGEFNSNESQVPVESPFPNPPGFLYHATFLPLLKKITSEGLDTTKAKKRFSDSVKGYVYLAVDPFIAESYAESAEFVPESWNEKVVILKIDTSQLDPTKLFLDRNVIDNEGSTLEYRGAIPVQAIVDYSSDPNHFNLNDL